jgi:hypothetical protein
MLDAQVIEDFAYALVDDILNGLGVMIERGYGWQDMGAHISTSGHKLQVAFVKRGLSNHED